MPIQFNRNTPNPQPVATGFFRQVGQVIAARMVANLGGDPFAPSYAQPWSIFQGRNPYLEQAGLGHYFDPVSNTYNRPQQQSPQPVNHPNIHFNKSGQGSVADQVLNALVQGGFEKVISPTQEKDGSYTVLFRNFSGNHWTLTMRKDQWEVDTHDQAHADQIANALLSVVTAQNARLTINVS